MRRLAMAGVWICLAAAPWRPRASPWPSMPDWRFLKQDAPSTEKPEFADSAWRTVNLPHDWSIEGPFDRQNTTGAAGAFLPAGIG